MNWTSTPDELNWEEQRELQQITVNSFNALKMLEEKCENNEYYNNTPGKEYYKSQIGKIIAYRPVIRNFKDYLFPLIDVVYKSEKNKTIGTVILNVSTIVFFGKNKEKNILKTPSIGEWILFRHSGTYRDEKDNKAKTYGIAETTLKQATFNLEKKGHDFIKAAEDLYLRVKNKLE